MAAECAHLFFSGMFAGTTLSAVVAFVVILIRKDGP